MTSPDMAEDRQWKGIKNMMIQIVVALACAFKMTHWWAF
jgi:hypothetical protein